MTDSSRNFWVGAFVVVALVVLGTLMAWFGETPDWLGGNEWTLRIVEVKGLSGVAAGTPVRLNGVEIGRVRSLDFVDVARPDLGVVVVARINERFNIPEGAKALVYGATLGFGSGRVDIQFDPTKPFKPLERELAQISGEMRSVIGELINKDMVESFRTMVDNIGGFAGAATPAATNFAKLMEPRTVAQVDLPETALQPNISTVVERLDDLAANLNTVLGDVNVQGDVKSVVRDLKTSTERLRDTIELWRTESQKLADNLNGGIDRTEQNLDRTFVQMHEVLDNLDDGAKSLASVLRTIAEGKGTAGMLTHDERLYESAVLSLQRLGEAMATLNRLLSKFESDGYITVGQAPTGFFKKDFPIPGGPAQPQQ